MNNPWKWTTIVRVVCCALLLLPWRMGSQATQRTPTWKLLSQAGGTTQAIAVQGDFAYLGVGLRMMVLDITDPAAIRETGASKPFDYFIEDIAVSGTRACVAAGGAGLYVVDIADPANPKVLGAWDSPGYAQGVTMAGQYAYLADGAFGLRVIDLSDPVHPREVGFAFEMQQVFDVAAAGETVYLAAGGGGLLVADVTDPQHPVEQATVDTPGYAYGVTVDDQWVYLADGWEGVRVYQRIGSAQATLTNSYKTPGWAFGVSAAGGLVYVADAFGGMRVLAIDPAGQLAELGGFETPGGHAGRVAVVGKTAYLADSNAGLWVVDATNPKEPVRAGFYGAISTAVDVAVSGAQAYVAAGEDGMWIFNAGDPQRIKTVGRYDTGLSALSLAVEGNIAYVSAFAGPSELHVVNISNPAAPVRIGYFEKGGLDTEVQGGKVYLADEWGLEIIGVSNPAQPALLGALQLADYMGAPNTTGGVAVQGSLVYITVSFDGLRVVDANDPANPKVIGEFDRENSFSQDLVVKGGIAYLADWHGFRILDVSDPTQPRELGYYDTPGSAESVVLEGTTAYVACGSSGVAALDVADPFHPQMIGVYDTFGYAQQLAVMDGKVYVADGVGGLLILELEGLTGLNPVNWKGIDHVALKSSAKGGYTELATGDREGRLASGPTTGTRMVETGLAIADREGDTGLKMSVKIDDKVTRVCLVKNNADQGAGSLRECLARGRAGDTIRFDPVIFPPENPAMITLKSALPALTAGGVTLEAVNAGVVLDGSQTPPGTNGLVIGSDGNSVKGLQITHFPGMGIQISQGSSGNQVGGSRLVGSAPLGEGNLISGNGQYGVYIYGPDTRQNRLMGNLIGLDVSGTQALENNAGIVIILGAQENFVGSDKPGEGNIISGNSGTGISMDGTQTRHNEIVGNYVGVDIHGTLAVGNQGQGIQVWSAENVIRGNLVSGNGLNGISLMGREGYGNLVANNRCGVDVSGTVDLGNRGHGIAMEGGTYHNRVEGNLSSGNLRAGIAISDRGSNYNEILGNRVGTDAGGTKAIPNEWVGVYVGGSSYNRIGGTRLEERNLISGNSMGLSVEGGVGNVVMGNWIGVDSSGKLCLGNSGAGVTLGGGSRTLLGGANPGEGNLIGCNNQNGIVIGSEYNVVAGNTIGTDLSGKLALGNRWGGVRLEAGNNVIQDNWIAFSTFWGPENGGDGIQLTNQTGNTIRRNSIYGNLGKGATMDAPLTFRMAAPVISLVIPQKVSGWTCAGCRVEIFSDEEDEGRIYEGSVLADAHGSFVFNKGTAFSGPYLTATTTDAEGSTTPFSTPVSAFSPQLTQTSQAPTQAIPVLTPVIKATAAEKTIVRQTPTTAVLTKVQPSGKGWMVVLPAAALGILLLVGFRLWRRRRGNRATSSHKLH